MESADSHDITVGKKALILNSRQSKQPRGSDSWVVKTIAAAEYAAANGYGLISSIGMNTYELVTYLAANLSIPLDLILPCTMTGMTDDILESFNLDRSITHVSTIESSAKSPKEWWLERDRLAIEIADLVLPVSINPEGNLAQMTGEKTVDDRFAVPYSKFSRKLYDPPNLACVAISPQQSWPYLTHWTRSFDGSWPNQKPFDYYDMMTRSKTGYSHSALNSLVNILETGILYGTGEHIHGGYEVVSFTERHPADAISLMKWRARFVRWNFEPYGITLDKNYARSIGILPVIYATPRIFDNLLECDKPFFQNRGEKSGDWEPEQEWRYHGDIDLNSVPCDMMNIIVRKRPEVDVVQRLTRCEVIVLTEEE